MEFGSSERLADAGRQRLERVCRGTDRTRHPTRRLLVDGKVVDEQAEDGSDRRRRIGLSRSKSDLAFAGDDDELVVQEIMRRSCALSATRDGMTRRTRAVPKGSVES